MNYGAKVAKAGHSVANPDAPPKGGDQSVDTVKEMISTLSLAFILGAQQQIERYKEAYAKAKTNPQAGVMYCLHEALTLLEDLDTLSWYTQKCGETHDLNKTIRNMRNHARHDIRENIDHESNDGRRKRAKQLGVHQNLMVHIGFDENAIKMGGTVLTLDEATRYIEWATNILTEVMAGAIQAGRIKGAEVVE
jgi:hypothetical protein